MSIADWQRMEAKQREAALAKEEALKALGLPELEATKLTETEWCVRPAGQLGTMGWFPRPWTAHFIHAATAEHAIEKARAVIWTGIKPPPPRKIRKS